MTMTEPAALAARGPRPEPPAPEARQVPASPRTLREQGRPARREQARAAAAVPALNRRCHRTLAPPEAQGRRRAPRGTTVPAAQVVPEEPAARRAPAPLAASTAPQMRARHRGARPR